MFERPLFLIAFLLTAIQLPAQQVEPVKLRLQQKDYSALHDYVLKMGPRHYRPGSYPDIHRQVVGKYAEVMYHFVDFQSAGDTAVKERQFYKLKLLIRENTIIHYKLVNELKKPAPVVEAEWLDETAFAALAEEYQQQYGRGVKPEDFFRDDIKYGGACGIAGVPLEYKVRLDSIVKAGEIASLEEWLTSPVTELQAFAVEGFYTLKKSGYKLTPRQLAWVKLVKQKTGNVRVCEGCLYDLKEIGKLMDRFKF